MAFLLQEDRFDLAFTCRARVDLQLRGGIPLSSGLMWKSRRLYASNISCKLIQAARLRRLVNKCTPSGSLHGERRSPEHLILQ